MRFTPASRHRSTWRRAATTSVAPTALNPPRPPNVIVPSVSADTRSPLRPSCRYSIVDHPSSSVLPPRPNLEDQAESGSVRDEEWEFDLWWQGVRSQQLR